MTKKEASFLRLWLRFHVKAQGSGFRGLGFERFRLP